MALEPLQSPSEKAVSMVRRAQRWWRIGSAVMVVAFAIDPQWPLHLRRLVLFLLTVRREWPG